MVTSVGLVSLVMLLWCCAVVSPWKCAPMYTSLLWKEKTYPYMTTNNAKCENSARGTSRERSNRAIPGARREISWPLCYYCYETLAIRMITRVTLMYTTVREGEREAQFDAMKEEKKKNFIRWLWNQMMLLTIIDFNASKRKNERKSKIDHTALSSSFSLSLSRSKPYRDVDERLDRQTRWAYDTKKKNNNGQNAKERQRAREKLKNQIFDFSLSPFHWYISFCYSLIEMIWHWAHLCRKRYISPTRYTLTCLCLSIREIDWINRHKNLTAFFS